MMESPSILPLVLLLMLMLNICVQESLAFQNLFSPPQWKFPSIVFDGSNTNNNKPTTSRAVMAMEDELLAAIASTSNRLSNDADIEALIQRLEGTRSIPEPAIAPQIYGVWRLL